MVLLGFALILAGPLLMGQPAQCSGASTYRFRMPILGVPIPKTLLLAQAKLDYSTPVAVIGNYTRNGQIPIPLENGWPDPAASTIWIDSNWTTAPGTGTESCPPGPITVADTKGVGGVFEHLLTVPFGESVTLYFSADDCGSLFVDGKWVAEDGSPAQFGWDLWAKATVPLSAGTHLIRIDEQNLATGGASVLFTALAAGKVVLHSDGSWVTPP